MSTPLVSDEQIRNEVMLTVQATPNRIMKVKNLPLSAYEVRDIYEAELQSLRERISRIDEAATNVLNRWDSPNWEWDKHGNTAGLMADLRNAIAAKP